MTPGEIATEAEHDVMRSPITMGELKAAVKLLRNGRAAGDDHVMNEMLKYAPTALLKDVLDLLNLCQQAEVIPESWNVG